MMFGDVAGDWVYVAPHPNPSPKGRGAFGGGYHRASSSGCCSPLPLGEGPGVRGGVKKMLKTM